MKFAIVTNATNTVLREFEAPSDYVAPAHKFGPTLAERVVAIVQYEAPPIQDGQALQPTETITEAELHRGWLIVDVPIEKGPVYSDPDEHVELDASPAAQARFTSLIALIREGIDFGALNNDSPQEIRDVNGVPHTLSVLRIRALMLRYGLYCKALFDEGDGKGGQPA